LKNEIKLQFFLNDRSISESVDFKKKLEILKSSKSTFPPTVDTFLSEAKILDGKVEFWVNGYNFGDPSVSSILGHSIILFKNIVRTAAYEMESDIYFEEYDAHVRLNIISNKIMISRFVGDKLKHSEKVDAIVLLREIAKFYKDVVFSALEKYPVLAEDQYFLTKLPLGEMFLENR